MEGSALKLLGAGVALIGSLGAGIGLGLIFSAWLTGISRNPSVEGRLFTIGMIGAALTEFVFLGGLVISFLLVFSK